MILGPGSLGPGSSIAGHPLLSAGPSTVNPLHEEDDGELLDLSGLTEYESVGTEERRTTTAPLQENEQQQQSAPADTGSHEDF